MGQTCGIEPPNTALGKKSRHPLFFRKEKGAKETEIGSACRLYGLAPPIGSPGQGEPAVIRLTEGATAGGNSCAILFGGVRYPQPRRTVRGTSPHTGEARGETVRRCRLFVSGMGFFSETKRPLLIPSGIAAGVFCCRPAGRRVRPEAKGKRGIFRHRLRLGEKVR